MENYTIKTLAEDIKGAVEWLREQECGCVTLKLNGTLAVCVGWSDGFDPDDETVIHSKTEPTWAICAAIKAWGSDDLRTDFDYIDVPHYEDGSAYDTEQSIYPDENYEWLAKNFLDEFEELKEMDIDEDGKIWTHRYYLCAMGYDTNLCETDFEKFIGEFNKYEDAYERFVEAQSYDWSESFENNADISYIQLQLEECREYRNDIECVEIRNEWIINKD